MRHLFRAGPARPFRLAPVTDGFKHVTPREPVLQTCTRHPVPRCDPPPARSGGRLESHPSSTGRPRFLRSAPAPAEGVDLSLIHISEPTRLGMISYAVF